MKTKQPVMAASFLALLGACGPSVQPFLGSWSVGGNTTVTLGAGSTAQPFSAAPVANYQIIFARGTSSDLVSLDNFGCRLLWSVSGTTATTEPNQTCTATGGGAQITIALTTGTISLTTVDASHLSGSANIAGTCTGGGSAGPCSAQAAGTLTLLSH